jgi:Fe-S cluster biogenesis protein NfuA
MKVLGIEPTPNPGAMKFVLDARIIESGSLHAASGAAPPPGAPIGALLAIQGVVSAFLMDNFVTLTVGGAANWPAIRAAVDAAVAGMHGPLPRAGEGAVLDDMGSRIENLMNLYIRPALAGDGGGIEIVKLEGENLIVRYQGACGTCPTSIGGTLFYIQSLLRTELKIPINVIPA